MNSSSDHTPQPLTPVLHWSLLAAGFVAVALGVLGIFLPVLPTVPFLLLALACFARSSERFYTWIIEHAHFGPLVRPYLEGRGMPRASKLKAIAMIWASIVISILFLLETDWVKAVLLVIALGVTLYLLRLPTAGPEERCDTD